MRLSRLDLAALACLAVEITGAWVAWHARRWLKATA